MPFAGEWADPAIGALNNLYYPYLWQAGGDIYNEDGTCCRPDGQRRRGEAPPGSRTTRAREYGVPPEPMALVAPRCATSSLRAHRHRFHGREIRHGAHGRRRQLGFHPQPGGRDPRHMDRSDALIMNSASQNGASWPPAFIKYITSAEVMAKFHNRDHPSRPSPGTRRTTTTSVSRGVRGRRAPAHAARRQRRVQGDGHPVCICSLAMLGDLSPEEAIQNTGARITPSIG